LPLVDLLLAGPATQRSSTPLGTAVGGPLVAGLGATATLAASGAATIALAAAASVLWKERDEAAASTPAAREGQVADA
jgi:hypothetical protein